MKYSPVVLLLIVGCDDGDQKFGAYNTAPVVSISLPVDGSSVDEGTLVEFQGIVTDSQSNSNELTVIWSSSIDGVLTDSEPADAAGNALFSTASLSVGNHAITLGASDPQGMLTEFSIVLNVNDVPDAPTIELVHPATGESGEEGEEFNFVVQVSDSQDAPDTMTIEFESDIDDVFCTPTADSIGVAECDQALSPGDHRLTFKVTDSTGLSATEEAYFTVLAATAIDNDGDGYTEDMGDCDDDGSVNPVATEFYNKRDEIGRAHV